MRLRAIPTGAAMAGKCGGLTAPLALIFMVAAPALAQPLPQSPPSAVAADDEAAHAKAQEPAAKVSKFEARHIRHACRERANERGLKGAERERFLSRCFFGRRMSKKWRRDCARQAAAEGIEKAAQHDFIQKCLSEKRAGGPAD